MKITMLLLFCILINISTYGQDTVDSTNWKSGIELGTGLSFTGYNANLAYTLTNRNNTVFIGPKVVYSDANALFDTPWGVYTGYRRVFPIDSKLKAFASVDYQLVLFKYDELEVSELNSIHEVHFSYGLEYYFTPDWSIGNSLGAGGYIERLVDPFDGRVDIIRGYSGHVRFFVGYHF